MHMRILAPQSGVEPTAPALVGEVSTTGPLGKSLDSLLILKKSKRYFPRISLKGLFTCLHLLILESGPDSSTLVRVVWLFLSDSCVELAQPSWVDVSAYSLSS